MRHNKRCGKYFRDGFPVYTVRVIEYQFRGLPHAHIVFRLSNGPCHSDKEECINWIESNICTSMPDITDASADDERKHFSAIQNHMLHKCFRGIIYKYQIAFKNI